LRILVVSQYFWPEQFLINELVSDLVKDGHEILVLTGQPNYPNGLIYPDFLIQRNKYSSYYGADIIRSKLIPRGKGRFGLLFNYLSFMLTSSFGLLKLRKKEKFDLVFFFQLSPIFSGLAAVLYKKVYKVPMVIWVQDIWPESLSATSQITNKKALGLIGLFVDFIYKHSDLILIQSESFRSKVLKRSSNPSKIHYLPNWADEIFSSNRYLDSVFYNKVPGIFDFVFAGNVGNAQDFDTVIEAVSKLENTDGFRMVIVGDGRAKKGALSKIELLGLSHKFLFLGAHDIEYMPSVFSKADALFVSLLDEKIFLSTIPSKVQAYLASGKPILASLGGAGADVVYSSGAGLISMPGNSSMLAEKIKQFLLMPDLELEEMGLRGKRYYQDNFDKIMLRKKLVALMNAELR
jgi:colanic acid biosynthesis glycosyl transferase WcaI